MDDKPVKPHLKEGPGNGRVRVTLRNFKNLGPNQIFGMGEVRHCNFWVLVDWTLTTRDRGGAAILKVRGTKHDSRAERAKKIFCTPHFSKCGGTSKQMSVLNTLKFAVWWLH